MKNKVLEESSLRRKKDLGSFVPSRIGRLADTNKGATKKRSWVNQCRGKERSSYPCEKKKVPWKGLQSTGPQYECYAKKSQKGGEVLSSLTGEVCGDAEESSKKKEATVSEKNFHERSRSSSPHTEGTLSTS